jgi:K+-transporting ATPase ATPase A chain
MVPITFAMFVAPASGMAAAFAFIRSFIRKNFGLGNFYVDFIRIILTLLLPVAFVSALLLMVLGVPQTLNGSITINHTLEGHNQTIPVGPVASLESIKELGSNGGGYFGANSGHPFENPNGLSNIYEMFLMLIIPVSFPIAYAKLVGRARGVSLLLTILIAFGILLAIAFSQHSGPTGLEIRLGSFGSEFFNTVSISTNTGSANSALTGMSPNPVISFLLAMFVQSIPGADGTGIMYMIVYVILTLFIVGLMVGKTPEFMNMKISPRDIKLAAFVFLIHPATILIPTVIAFTTGNAQSVLAIPAGKPVTASGFTQTLYEYASAAANNGSDYFGTSANTPFWNWSTAIIMFLGRYTPLILMLAVAGSFTLKDRKEAIEPIKTHGPLFISVLLTMTFLLTALTFFPVIVIGPFSM